MGLWRIGYDLYGECETWVPERSKFEWPAESDSPPCDICTGKLVRRKYTFRGKDDQIEHSGYRYTLTHYGRDHDQHHTVHVERRRTA